MRSRRSARWRTTATARITASTTSPAKAAGIHGHRPGGRLAAAAQERQAAVPVRRHELAARALAARDAGLRARRRSRCRRSSSIRPKRGCGAGAYYAAVTKADDDLGSVLEAVGKTLDPKNTFVFFTSDHGAQWPFGKWNLYDAGMRVPLIVAGPGIKAGAATDAMVSWIDLLPTLVELAGGPAAGRDRRPIVRGRAAGQDRQASRRDLHHAQRRQPVQRLSDSRRFATAAGSTSSICIPSFSTPRTSTARQPATACRTGTPGKRRPRPTRGQPPSWNATKQRPREELYDLAADPHEQTNLAADPQHAERLAAFRDKLAAWMKDQGDSARVFNEPLLLGQEATPIQPAAKAKTPKDK